jgi:hypothetical protein
MLEIVVKTLELTVPDRVRIVHATMVRHASVNDTEAADSAERIDDPDGLLVREA